MKIALINMPFSTIAYPALGISLLQAAARRDGFHCDTHYFNLEFAKRIGIDAYEQMANFAPTNSLAGEWVFRDGLFGAQRSEERNYLQEVLLQYFAGHFTMAAVLEMFTMREAVEPFLEACLAACDWSQYRVVGFTSTFHQNIASLALAKQIKQKFPPVLIAFGGANCEGEMGIELHRQFPFLDFVFSGEADLSFPELLRQLDVGQSGEGIKGVVARGAAGETIIPPEPVWPVHAMDALPVPDYTQFFEQFQAAGFAGKIETQVPIETSRGCWWGAKSHCTFCGLNGSTMSYRSKSPQRALDEIDALGERFGKDFLTVDNILDMKYFDTVIAELARRDDGYSFHYEVKVNLKKPQMRLLRAAGVKHLQPGIENLSTQVLRLMRKGCSLMLNVQFLKWAAEYGMVTGWNFLYGFPGEDPAEYERVAALIPSLAHLEAPMYSARVRIDRYSPFHSKPQEFGLTNCRAQRAYGHVYPFSSEVLDRLAYFFDFDHPQWLRVEEYAASAQRELRAWRNQPLRPVLDADVTPEMIHIRDTRFQNHGEAAREYELLGSEREVYLFCDEARSFAAIEEHSGMDAAALRVFLDRLVALRLMIAEGNSYLSLAVLRAEVPEAVSIPLPELRVLG